jgi:hypothetical protein
MAFIAPVSLMPHFHASFQHFILLHKMFAMSDYGLLGCEAMPSGGQLPEILGSHFLKWATEPSEMLVPTSFVITSQKTVIYLMQ